MSGAIRRRGAALWVLGVTAGCGAPAEGPVPGGLAELEHRRLLAAAPSTLWRGGQEADRGWEGRFVLAAATIGADRPAGPALAALAATEEGAPVAERLRREAGGLARARFRERWGLGLFALALGGLVWVAGGTVLSVRVAPGFALVGGGAAAAILAGAGLPWGPVLPFALASSGLLHAGESATRGRRLGPRGRAITLAVVVSGMVGAGMAVEARASRSLVWQSGLRPIAQTSSERAPSESPRA